MEAITTNNLCFVENITPESELYVGRYSGSAKIRDGLEVRWGATKENSRISDRLGFWWGLYVDGTAIWQDRELFHQPDCESELPTPEQIKELAIYRTARWLDAVSTFIKDIK